ncbi:MAG: hypothetical protein KC492_45430, partial [Myxococcales bacterium]|nr:hypothetical protein [Myxococcales bacterium]
IGDDFLVSNRYLPTAKLLREHLRCGYVFTEHEVVRLAEQVASVLVHAHDVGVVFGQLNDVSVLYDPELGHAHVACLPATQPSSASPLAVARFLGIPFFHSPDVLAGAAADPKSDIYSLCMLLHVLCAGEHPFVTSPDIGQVCLSIVNQDPPELAADVGASTWLKDAIASGLGGQCQTARELHDRLAVGRESHAVVATELRMAKVGTRHFPYPMARHLQLFDSLPEPGFRLTQLSSFAEATVSLLGAITLAELASGELETPACAAQLDRPSLGHWLGVCREGLRVLRDEGAPVLCGDLVDAFFDKRGKPATGALALDDLVAWRNRRVGHARQSEVRDVVAAVKEGEALMRRIVRSLAFLSRLSLVQVESLEYREARFLTHLVRLDGTVIRRRTVELDHAVTCGEVLLANATYTRVLSLQRHLRFEVCPECGQEDLFVYQSAVRGTRRFVGFHGGHEVKETVG